MGRNDFFIIFKNMIITENQLILILSFFQMQEGKNVQYLQ